eukprot:TRINITY_DN2873_c0_g1_i1.p1 TRINITY_DN2873_c0_g1~~TRINITY_DN2873_c0_g1_i1.p1  ORF type:complete len:568 (-),score=161.06 TRINITY_DN2873_c0_g1_i1:970-2673(-)
MSRPTPSFGSKRAVVPPPLEKKSSTIQDEDQQEKSKHQQVKKELEQRLLRTLIEASTDSPETIPCEPTPDLVGPSPPSVGIASNFGGQTSESPPGSAPGSRGGSGSSGSKVAPISFLSGSSKTSDPALSPSIQSPILPSSPRFPIGSPPSAIGVPPPLRAPPPLKVPTGNEPFQPTLQYYIESSDIEVALSGKNNKKPQQIIRGPPTGSIIRELPNASVNNGTSQKGSKVVQDESKDWWFNLLTSSGIHPDRAPKYVDYINTHIGFSNFISNAEQFIPQLQHSCNLTEEDKAKLFALLSDPKEPKQKKYLFRKKESKTDNISTSGSNSLTSSTSSSNNTPNQSNQKSSKKGKNKKLELQNWEGRKSMIGLPFNFQHQVHVDFNFNWSGSEEVEKFFVLEEKLGQGAYGAVYRGKHRESGFILAIKVIEDMSDAETLKKEIEILRKCKNANIVCYYGSLTHGKHLWILMDYCALGSIRDLIETTEKTLSEKQIAFICKNTLKGLVYLHAQKIIHRDIKAANILLNDQAEVKLADFGVSEQLNAGKSASDEMIGTPLWMAPEVIKKNQV